MRWPGPMTFFAYAALIKALSVSWHLMAPKAEAVPPLESYVAPAPAMRPVTGAVTKSDAHDVMVLWWTAREEADVVLAAFAEPVAHRSKTRRRASEEQIKSDCYDDFMRLCGFSVAMEGRAAAIKCMKDNRAEAGPQCKRHLW